MSAHRRSCLKRQVSSTPSFEPRGSRRQRASPSPGAHHTTERHQSLRIGHDATLPARAISRQGLHETRFRLAKSTSRSPLLQISLHHCLSQLEPGTSHIETGVSACPSSPAALCFLQLATRNAGFNSRHTYLQTFAFGRPLPAGACKLENSERKQVFSMPISRGLVRL